MQVNEWLSVLGLSLDLIGAIFLAYGLIIEKKKAIELGLSRWSSDVDEENLALPQVQDRLKQSKNALIGVMFLSLGFLMQIVGALAK